MGRPPKDAPALPLLTPIRSDRSSPAAQVMKTLTEYFFSGGVQPGQKLPSERQLSELLEVNRSAVRDAVQTLGLLGIVEIRPGDGTYLRAERLSSFPAAVEWGLFLGERRVMDLVEARQQIEIALAGFAAERRSDEQLRQMEAALRRMADPVVPSGEFVEADVAFHFAIAEASRNSALSDVLSGITTLLRAWMTRSIKAAGETRSSFQEHEAVFAAIRSGDGPAARSAMEEHMRNAEARLRRTLQDVPGLPEAGKIAIDRGDR